MATPETTNPVVEIEYVNASVLLLLTSSHPPSKLEQHGRSPFLIFGAGVVRLAQRSSSERSAAAWRAPATSSMGRWDSWTTRVTSSSLESFNLASIQEIRYTCMYIG